MNLKKRTIHLVESIIDSDHKFRKMMCRHNMVFEIADIQSKTDFERYIEELSKSIRQGMHPELILDIHGNPDGLVFKDNTTLAYGDTASLMRILNKACVNNLIVIAGVCHAKNLHDHYNPKLFPPYRYLIAGKEYVWDGDCCDGYEKFSEMKVSGISTPLAFEGFKSAVIESDRKTFQLYGADDKKIKNSVDFSKLWLLKE